MTPQFWQRWHVRLKKIKLLALRITLKVINLLVQGVAQWKQLP